MREYEKSAFLTFCFRRLQESQAAAVRIRLSSGTLGLVISERQKHGSRPSGGVCKQKAGAESKPGVASRNGGVDNVSPRGWRRRRSEQPVRCECGPVLSWSGRMRMRAGRQSNRTARRADFRCGELSECKTRASGSGSGGLLEDFEPAKTKALVCRDTISTLLILELHVSDAAMVG